MTDTHHSDPAIRTMLGAWTDLAPDPQAMEQVTALLIEGVRSAPHVQTAELNEAHFRLLTYVWFAVALCAYFARNYLFDWFAANPILTGLMVLVGVLCLVAPLLLLPILLVSHERSSSPC